LAKKFIAFAKKKCSASQPEKSMALTTQQKSKATASFKRHEKDTGSAEYQIALFTAKIERLVTHLNKNPKDKHSRRGLLGMVQQRKKLLKFLKNSDEKRYKKVIKELGLKG
jgi:small subunit ribosomal protein S15